MTVQIHVARAERAAQRLFDAFQGEGDGIFGVKDMPEDVVPSGVRPGTEEHLRFLTFTVAIDYQRPAAQLWQASREAFEAPEWRHLYDPPQVVTLSHEELKRSLTALNISRKHDPDAKTWRAVASTLHQRYDGRVFALIESCGYSAIDVLETIRTPPSRIRFLAGEKIGPLWLRMLLDNGGVPLSGMNALPVPVDVHVARATLAIGAIAASGRVPLDSLVMPAQNVWAGACEGKAFYALRLDEPLWQQSRLGCTNRSEEECQKSHACLLFDLCVRGKITFRENSVEVGTLPLRPMM